MVEVAEPAGFVASMQAANATPQPALLDATMSKLVQASEAAQAEAIAEEELVECFACGGAGLTFPDYEYQVILKNGRDFFTTARVDPLELSKTVYGAKVDKGFVVWGDGQFTSAEDIAHVRLVIDGEESQETGDGSPDAGADADADSEVAR